MLDEVSQKRHDSIPDLQRLSLIGLAHNCDGIYGSVSSLRSMGIKVTSEQNYKYFH